MRASRSAARMAALVAGLSLGGGASSADPAHDAAIEEHVAALERAAEVPPEELLEGFERARFSEAFLARTTRDERRELLEAVREAAANAGGALLDLRGQDVVLVLRGPGVSTEVVLRVDPAPPHEITALAVRGAGSGAPPLRLTRETLPETFEALAREGFSGVVHVRLGGDVVLERAHGLANPALGVPMRLDTVFGIGSTPIVFTIAAIELLAQRGEIDLDAPISRYLGGVPADKRAMTARHLLEGASGLPDFFDTGDDWDADLAWIDRAEAERRMLAQPLRFPPGKGRAHSHAAFVLLAALVERVSGESYATFLRERFFDPAGMTRTGFYGESRGLSIGDFAVGPGPSRIGVPNIPPNWGPTSWLIMGSGGMYATLGDMLRFYAYVRSGKVLDAQHLERYTGAGRAVGGSERGFYILHAYDGAGDTALMIVNMEGRSPEMRRLSDALLRLVGAGEANEKESP